MIHKFIESKQLFAFLAHEQQFLARELGISYYHSAKIARRLGIPAKRITHRIEGHTKSYPAEFISMYARELEAKLTLFIGDDFRMAYNDENCRIGMARINELRAAKVIPGEKLYTLDAVAKEMKVSVSYLTQLRTRQQFIDLDPLVMYGEIIDVSVYVEAEHDFRSEWY